MEKHPGLYNQCSENISDTKNFRRNIIESIESIPRSDAFKRPNSDRNMIGFGFQVHLKMLA